MPESIMMAVAGGREKVTGSRRAIAPAGPIPGRTPTSVPTKQPTQQNITFIGVRAILNPIEIF
jgi:hypothetical protein